MTSVPFFFDEFALEVDTASLQADVGRIITAREFLANRPGSLVDLGDGRYRLSRFVDPFRGDLRVLAFIEGVAK